MPSPIITCIYMLESLHVSDAMLLCLEPCIAYHQRRVQTETKNLKELTQAFNKIFGSTAKFES